MSSRENNILLVITGPTATGKTRLAVLVAHATGREVISADSRQVYRGMDLGSGKDLDDFLVEGRLVPYHLIDIAEPGAEYNVFEYQGDFLNAYRHIRSRNSQAILCGGTGMYIEAAIKGYRMLKVPKNLPLRSQLSPMTMEELSKILARFGPLHNTTDTGDRERLVRAIEIQEYQKTHSGLMKDYPVLNPKLFAIHFDRAILRQRITERLDRRLAAGMTREIEQLLKKGLKPSQLVFYGLEYRYVTRYVVGEISWDQMVTQLNTAIHQFAKRQMTWFRRMERRGTPIQWIDGRLPEEEKMRQVIEKAGLQPLGS